MQYNKFFVLLFLLCLSEYAAAQRTADLAVSNLYKPEYIVSSKGTEVLFSVRNNGPDSLFTSDSLIIFFIFNSQQSNMILRKPGSVIAPGDSQMISMSIGSLPPVSNSGTTTFCINARAVNRSADSLKPEQGTLSDNQKCNSIYVNATGTETPAFTEPELRCWPNPSYNGNMTLSFVNPEITNQGRIILADAQGRTLEQLYSGPIGSGRQEFAFSHTYLAPGSYYYVVFLDRKAVFNNFIVSK